MKANKPLCLGLVLLIIALFEIASSWPSGEWAYYRHLLIAALAAALLAWGLYTQPRDKRSPDLTWSISTVAAAFAALFSLVQIFSMFHPTPAELHLRATDYALATVDAEEEATKQAERAEPQLQSDVVATYSLDFSDSRDRANGIFPDHYLRIRTFEELLPGDIFDDYISRSSEYYFVWIRLKNLNGVPAQNCARDLIVRILYNGLASPPGADIIFIEYGEAIIRTQKQLCDNYLLLPFAWFTYTGEVPRGPFEYFKRTTGFDVESDVLISWNYKTLSRAFYMPDPAQPTPSAEYSTALSRREVLITAFSWLQSQATCSEIEQSIGICAQATPGACSGFEQALGLCGRPTPTPCPPDEVILGSCLPPTPTPWLVFPSSASTPIVLHHTLFPGNTISGVSPESPFIYVPLP
jgi:hypothetical protein